MNAWCLVSLQSIGEHDPALLCLTALQSCDPLPLASRQHALVGTVVVVVGGLPSTVHMTPSLPPSLLSLLPTPPSPTPWSLASPPHARALKHRQRGRQCKGVGPAQSAVHAHSDEPRPCTTECCAACAVAHTPSWPTQHGTCSISCTQAPGAACCTCQIQQCRRQQQQWGRLPALGGATRGA